MIDRITWKNPDGKTYRIPFYMMGDFRVMQGNGMFGELVDRLGKYEDCLTLEEAQRYVREKERFGKAITR